MGEVRGTFIVERGEKYIFTVSEPGSLILK
jgi:hypothetical protein